MIRDRSRPVRTVSRTKWATCPEGTKSWTDGGSSQTWSTSQGRNVLLIRRLNHDDCSSSRKIRLLGQAPSPNKGHAPRPAAALIAGDRRLQARRAALAPQPACQGGTRYCAVWLQIFFEDALRLAHGLCAVRVQAFGSFMR